jgi:hypothetical protein
MLRSKQTKQAIQIAPSFISAPIILNATLIIRQQKKCENDVHGVSKFPHSINADPYDVTPVLCRLSQKGGVGIPATCLGIGGRQFRCHRLVACSRLCWSLPGIGISYASHLTPHQHRHCTSEHAISSMSINYDSHCRKLDDKPTQVGFGCHIEAVGFTPISQLHFRHGY